LIRNAIRIAVTGLLLCGPMARAESTPAAQPHAEPEHATSTADTLTLDWSTVPEYRLVPNDVITLDFGPRADLNGDILREVTVRPDGRISVFPIGDVVAAGRTPKELEAALVQLLSGDIRAPRVTVELTKLAANVVHVFGEVQKPGPVPAEPYFTVTQAITAAGGFKDGAAKNSVLVFNRNGANTVKVALVRVDEMLNRGSLVGDLRLSRFDIVYVPRSGFGNLEVYTRQVFASLLNVTGFAIEGWELFNLDRVFFVPGHN
jgi:polysaccharide export outer membrane protein